MHRLRKSGEISDEAYADLSIQMTGLAGIETVEAKDELKAEDRIKSAIVVANRAKVKAGEKALKRMNEAFGITSEESSHIFEILGDTTKTTREREVALRKYMSEISFTKKNVSELEEIKKSHLSEKEKREKTLEIVQNANISQGEKSKLMYAMSGKVSGKEAERIFQNIYSKNKDLSHVGISDIISTLNTKELFGERSLSAKEIYTKSEGDASKILSRISEQAERIEKNTKVTHEGFQAVVDAVVHNKDSKISK